VDRLHVAIVSLDAAMRLEVARAFDRAPASWAVSLHKTIPPEADVVVVTPEVDGDGVRFDPAEPERVIDDVAAASRSAGNVFVVTGASGGVGATSIALHVAAALGRRSRTCYFDLDVGWGIRARLGMPPDARTWGDVEDDEESFVLAALPIASGVRAFVAPSDRDHDPLDVLRRAAESFDHVIVDAPRESLDVATQVASAGVLVASPTFPSIERAREVLRATAIRWAVVTNRLGAGGEATKLELEEALGRSIGLELPCAPRLRDAEDDRRLLEAGWSRWAGRIDRLATVLGEM
jgi:hypothetical protein